MVTITHEPLKSNLSIGTLAKYDTKANMLDTIQLIGVDVPKSWDKTALSRGLDMIFSQPPALFANVLPLSEQTLLAGLLECKQSEYVSSPVGDGTFLMLQRLHLVVTYECGDAWHLYMPDDSRQRLQRMASEDIKQYPEIEQFQQLLSELTTHRNQLYALMDRYNPDALTAQQSQQLSVAVRPISQFYAGVRPRLKKLEPYLKAHTQVDLDLIYKDIEMAEILLALAEDDMKGV